ncbi:polysaccharide biosynthesis protein [Formosa agariphila KMM 3901]|uniref:Polysaccharide biosynthesis protein n=1 Tax=Formosa agariphila (strain DSM 15362 / KCTC 12365 / LMG 23005 / KMM 3901 / M-2Alg 35-1) TaxID=1347342 RepID=T2KKI7_FORAG|nr:oligosaccharide flippase family protein [Formosa agariphila]CDF78953.1 polysaccharide biosynthesis protein [Formosa agariphila KMM 3901]
MPIAFSRKDLNSTAWFSLEKLIQLFAGVFIIPKIFNTLGTVDIGKLHFVEALLGMFAPVFFLGLTAISIREMVLKPKQSEKIVATTFFIRLISWLLLSTGILGYLLFTKNTALFNLYIILLLSYLFRLTDVFESFFLAKKQAKFIFISKITSLIIIILLQYYGVKHNLDVLYFAKVLALDFLIQGIIYGIALLTNKSFSLKKLSISLLLGKELLIMAIPLMISSGLVMLYIGIDEMFLKYFYNDHANGVFGSVQYLVIGLSWTLGFAIINALYPSLAESYKDDNQGYISKFRQLTSAMILLGIGIGLFYTVFGNYILNTYFLEQYTEAKSPLKIFCWSPLLVFIGMLYEKHLLTINQLEHEVYRFALGCVTNLVLCYYLIPIYYLNGAAAAVLLSHLVTNIIYPLVQLSIKNRRLFILNLK